MPRTFTQPGGKQITLSPDQDRAVTTLMRRLSKPGSVAVLAGAAGTGKTTTLNALLHGWHGNVIFLAPTGKAANRVKELTGHRCSTVHSGVYRAVEEKEGKGRKTGALLFGEPAPPHGCGFNTLVVVDEASMMNCALTKELVKQVQRVGGRVLGVGDHEQLPPVEGTWGFNLQNPDARLDKVHRQALESPVLELATLIRQGRGKEFSRWGDKVRRMESSIQEAVAWMEECREVDALVGFAAEGEAADLIPTRVLLTWTNIVRCRANTLVRVRRGYSPDSVHVGETLIATFNSHATGKMNGELVEVARVEDVPELTKLLGRKVQKVTEIQGKKETYFYVIPSLFDTYDPAKSDRQVLRDVWKPLWASKKPEEDKDGNLPESVFDLLARMGWDWGELNLWRDRVKAHQLQATWGYCITVHKSQGSQWDEVGFISCPFYRSYEDREFIRRLTYTAITRAAERFTAFILRVKPKDTRKNPYKEAA